MELIKQPKVTVVVIQRERFSYTQHSLESILADQSYPFDLIYVDGGSPDHVYSYLRHKEQQTKGMTLIRVNHFLKTNEARNLALPLIEDSDYVAFIDNDVVVESGWLERLVICAEEEQADLVAPLILEGHPELPDQEKMIHIAGVDISYTSQHVGRSSLTAKYWLHHAKLDAATLARRTVDCIETHAGLIRRSVLNEVWLDPEVDELNNHLDIAIQAKLLNKRVVLEPSAVVTFLSPALVRGFDPADHSLHVFRWSEENVTASINRFRERWNLDPHCPILWGQHRWAISNRQLPLKWAADSNWLTRNVLKVCKLRFCPSPLRRVIESAVSAVVLSELKVVWPQVWDFRTAEPRLS